MSDLKKSLGAINKRIRNNSGMIDIDSRLTGFLYLLMRDKLATGEVEDLMQKMTSEDGFVDPHSVYTNGWLALYAADIADRLLDDGPPIATTGEKYE